MDKLISFTYDGIINENVIFQFKHNQYYMGHNANLNFFVIAADDLERILNNDEACSKLIEVMNENISGTSEESYQKSDVAVEIKKLRRHMDDICNKIEELEEKFDDLELCVALK